MVCQKQFNSKLRNNSQKVEVFAKSCLAKVKVSLIFLYCYLFSWELIFAIFAIYFAKNSQNPSKKDTVKINDAKLNTLPYQKLVAYLVWKYALNSFICKSIMLTNATEKRNL